jgi:hypothetical protein
MSFWAIVFLGKCSSGQTSSGQMSFWANVFLGKHLLGKCLYGQMSFWANVALANVLLGKRRMGKCIRANMIKGSGIGVLAVWVYLASHWL